MTEPKPQYHIATPVSLKESLKNCELTKTEKMQLRTAARMENDAWRSIAKVSMKRLQRAQPAIKSGLKTMRQLRQDTADECGKDEDTVRRYETLERTWGEHLDELPKSVLFTYHKLDYVTKIAKAEGKDRTVVFWELVDEAISRRDRLGDESGEHVIVASSAVLANRANGRKPDKDPVFDPLHRAANSIAQAFKHIEGTQYKGWRDSIALLEKIVLRHIERMEKSAAILEAAMREAEKAK